MVRPTRPQNWCIEENEDGSYNVTHGNRPVSHEPNYLRAVRQVSTRHRARERVFRAEIDGYRTEITKLLTRAGMIGSPGLVPLNRLRRRLP